MTGVPSVAESHKQQQRERILKAATRCFVREGFHSASMATIAATAGMSPGLIYRYFENKNAIILAIIESQLAIIQQRVREMRSTDDLATTLVDYFESQDAEDVESISAPLFMEMSAEAARDPEIGAAIHRIDLAVRAELADWLARSPDKGGHGLAPEIARQRALAFVILIDGLKARKTREPDLDRACLKRAVDALVAAVLER
mgnify:CR=1 FL=1